MFVRTTDRLLEDSIQFSLNLLILAANISWIFDKFSRKLLTINPAYFIISFFGIDQCQKAVGKASFAPILNHSTLAQSTKIQSIYYPIYSRSQTSWSESGSSKEINFKFVQLEELRGPWVREHQMLEIHWREK